MSTNIQEGLSSERSSSRGGPQAGGSILFGAGEDLPLRTGKGRGAPHLQDNNIFGLPGYEGEPEETPQDEQVLRPPGGVSSDIFGSAGEPQQKVKVNPQQQSHIFGGPDDSASHAQVPRYQQPTTSLFGSENTQQENPSTKKQEKDEEEEEEEEKGERDAEEVPKAEERNNNENAMSAAGQEAKPRGRFNPITGEAVDNGQAAQVSSTKARQPPGGASSGLW